MTLTVGAAGGAYALAAAERPTAAVTAGDAPPQEPVDDAAPTTDVPTP